MKDCYRPQFSMHNSPLGPLQKCWETLSIEFHSPGAIQCPQSEYSGRKNPSASDTEVRAVHLEEEYYLPLNSWWRQNCKIACYGPSLLAASTERVWVLLVAPAQESIYNISIREYKRKNCNGKAGIHTMCLFLP